MSLSRKQFCHRAAAGVLGALAAPPARLWGSSGSAAAGSLPLPTPQQRAWQDYELGLFIHFDMVTYTGQMKPHTPAPPDTYNPSRLDTDQWLETAKAMGAKYAVFVAKHCTGFLSWQSDAYPYGVRQTAWRNGKGDVVADFVASCRRYGIQPGLYASVSCNAWWGVDNPGVIRWGDRRQADYVKACETLVTELWSNYGELAEIWFDGGVLPPEKGGPDLLPILRRLQPNAVVFQSPGPGGVRWIGNEKGAAAYPCWSTVSRLNDSGPGDPDGATWTPGECDVPLPGHDWFWRGEAKPGRPDDATQADTLERLMDMYYRSVGHNCNLLLNATPDTTGRIPDAIAPHYANFGREIQRRFGQPLAETAGEGCTVELALPQPANIDHVVVMEELSHGERIRAYRIEALTPGNAWVTLCDGLAVGHKRIQTFPRREVAKLRLQVTKAAGEPKIRRLAAYFVG